MNTKRQKKKQQITSDSSLANWIQGVRTEPLKINMENFVCSLEQSKRFLELGIRQESQFYWKKNRVYSEAELKELGIPLYYLVHSGTPNDWIPGYYNFLELALEPKNYIGYMWSAFNLHELILLNKGTIPEHILSSKNLVIDFADYVLGVLENQPEVERRIQKIYEDKDFVGIRPQNCKTEFLPFPEEQELNIKSLLATLELNQENLKVLFGYEEQP